MFAERTTTISGLFLQRPAAAPSRASGRWENVRIGVFCSGGDAPGMNACLRAVVRSGIAHGHQVVGIRRGYEGLLEEDFHTDAQGNTTMSLRSVSGIVQHGGTILRSSRSETFRTTDGLTQAAAILNRHAIDAIIPIGGDGTFRGPLELCQHWPGQIIGCPGTIDNDLRGTDFSIGFHTAVATAVDAVDKLRDTADSHERLFLVEVMGRHSGYIALYCALAGGAEIACLPETATDVDALIEQLCRMKQRHKSSVMAIVAEGDEAGGAESLKQQLVQADCPFDARVVILGHLQRGGSPAAPDRILGARLGDFAVRSIIQGSNLAMAGEIGGELALTPLSETVGHKPVPQSLLDLLATLAQ